MKNYSYLFIVAALIFSACSEKKTDSPQPEAGYLEGTFRMTSTQTITADTTIYPSGSQVITRNETYTGVNFAGTLTVTKTTMQLNGFSYNINNAGETKTYTASNGQTTVQPFSTVINNVSAPSVAATYTLSGNKDSITISNSLDIVQSRYTNPGKYQVAVSGNTVTFSVNHYTSSSTGGYTNKNRNITTTVYQKQ
ncbi:MAG: hypothetical protein K2Q24_05175 [Chitinophagaceae bacterium]|jgi:hypothetical protein|nr:hypothetical protein [Chitinophagaceae bacterium]